MSKQSDREWRSVNAAIDCLREHGQPLHVDLVTEIVGAHYWHWDDEPPTVAQMSRALNRARMSAFSRGAEHAYEIPASPGRVLRQEPAVWRWVR